MPLPPGIDLLVKTILPKALGPPLLVYGILRLVHYLTYGADWSSDGQSSFWSLTATISISLFIHPAIWVLSDLYNQLRRKRDAAARGAILPPLIRESSLQIVKAQRDSTLKGYIGDAAHAWAKQYGNTYRFQIFGSSRLFTTEPEHVKAILATQFDDFWKGPQTEDNFGSLLGSGVFNSDGDMWKFHRNMTRPFFSKVRISDFDVFERHAEDTLSLLAERSASGTPIDFQDAVARFTLDSATEFLLGKSVESLSAGLPYPGSHPLATSTSRSISNHPSIKFVNAFALGQESTVKRIIIGKYWRFLEFWKDEALEHRKVMEEFVSPILDRVLDNQKSRKMNDAVNTTNAKEVAEDETFLEHLVKLTEDRKLVIDELLNILLAARDTTASLLTFSVYVLTQRPDIYARLKAEIAEHVGNARPTYQDTRDMKYLRAFLNEVLRLYPPVPFDGRSSRAATTLPNKGGLPWYIPADTQCTYSVFLMHRREDLWGPDALEFDPDRFLDERVHKYLTPNPFIFLPFNAGPRICLGQQFAYNEASYFLIKFIQKFTDLSLALDVQPSQPPKEWVPQPGTTKGRDKVMLWAHLTMSVRDGLWVRMNTTSQVEGV